MDAEPLPPEAVPQDHGVGDPRCADKRLAPVERLRRARGRIVRRLPRVRERVRDVGQLALDRGARESQAASGVTPDQRRVASRSVSVPGHLRRPGSDQADQRSDWPLVWAGHGVFTDGGHRQLLFRAQVVAFI